MGVTTGAEMKLYLCILSHQARQARSRLAQIDGADLMDGLVNFFLCLVLRKRVPTYITQYWRDTYFPTPDRPVRYVPHKIHWGYRYTWIWDNDSENGKT